MPAGQTNTQISSGNGSLSTLVRPKAKPRGLFVLDPRWLNIVYAPEDLELLRAWLDVPDHALSPEDIKADRSILKDMELLFSSWGGGRLDRVFLDAAPKLRAVFYGAGSVRGFVTDDFWERGIPLSSAASANAVPVAEFTLAQIILSLKRAWWYIRELRETRVYPSVDTQDREVAGTYHSTVGIISLGLVGRRLREMLRALDLQVLAYDPYVTRDAAAALDVELVSLDELFQRSDVITIHTPSLKETEGLITSGLILQMKRHATLINTSRGDLIDEPGLIEALRARPDIFAVLDVACQDPLPADSLLYTVPNIVLTPHIAGSLNAECRRMGRLMIEEARRFLHGADLLWQVSREKAAISA